MKKLIVLLLLVASSIMLISISQVEAAEGRITLKRLAGTVQYKSKSWLFFSSDWKELDESTSLSKGDLIKTGPEGQAQLTFANQARTLIKSNSKLKVVKHDEGSGVTKVKLSLGEVLTKFINTVKSGQQFEVETPSATAGVRGTLFRVVVNEKKETQVGVEEGEVEVSSEGGTVMVGKGEGAVVKEKKQKPEVVPVEEIKVQEQKKQNEGQGRARGKEKDKGKPEEEWLEENKEWAQEAKENAKEKKEKKEKAEEAKNKGKDNNPGIGNDKDADHPGNSNSSNNNSSNNSNNSSNNSSNSSGGSSNSSSGGSSNSKGGGRP